MMTDARRRAIGTRWGLWVAVVGVIAAIAIVGVASGALAIGKAPPKPRKDQVTLRSGEKLEGTLLDRTKSMVVIWVDGKKQVHARSDVSAIERAKVNQKRLDKAKEAEKAASKKPSASRWRKLADYYWKYELYLEYRRALRRLFRVDSGDEDVRIELGLARLDGQWLSELEVYEKTKDGQYEIDDSGDLVAKSKTIVKTDDTKSNIRILEREKLSATEVKKIEEKRARRIKSAEKFRRKLAREYEGVEWNDRFRERTRYFEVHCNATPQLTKRYARLMELIRAKLSNHFPSRTINRGRAPVFIYCNQEEFMNNDLFARWGGRGLGGYYMPSNQSITTYHGTFGFTGTTYKVLAHEGVHYYQGLVLKGGFDNLPMWMIEGLAVYFGDGSKFDADKQRITTGLIPRDRLAHIQEKMIRKSHAKVRKLIALDRRSGFSGSHYADAWALIYYLVKGPDKKKGERLMQEYWGRGLEKRLRRDDFIELAEKYYGSVEKLEEDYVKFILSLRPPSAGVVRGDYFVSEDFQFELKSPDSDWQFFEDLDDKELLIGILKPNSSARVKMYYTNNIENLEREDYFDEYQDRVARRYEDFDYEEVKMAGLPAYRLTYVDEGNLLDGFSIEFDSNGKPIFPDPDELRKRKPEPRDVMKFMLIQVDGVASIECSTKKGEIGDYEDAFSKMNEHFSIMLTRRW